ISLVLFIAPKNASRVFLASMKLTFLNGQPAVAQDFSEYDTSFADGESTEVNFVDFTMELPAEFKLKAKTEHSETYVSQNKKIIISTSPDKESESIQYDIISYLRKISPATNQEKLILSEEAVEAHFGFIPSSKTDYERFYRALEKNKKFPLTKELATGIFYCYAQYSDVFSEKHFDSDTRLLYDKNNIDGILVKSNEAESVTTFNFDFEIVNPPSYPYTVTIYYNNAKPDMKEVYKIINSINNT
ncbi:MAG: hypothetical protein IKC01_03275, partial [Clostridia bacterium]|nr:hypothetical protein [Clostridia bacterium]